MANVPHSPPLQAGSTTQPNLRSYTRRIIRAKRAFATSSDKPPQDEIKIPGTHPTAGRAGIDAEIWKTYVSEASDYDKNLIASWNEDLDVLLIFAGLFSAVLTAFIIESRKDLQEDYQKTSADLLRILIDQSSNKTVPATPTFEVALSSVRVNVLWFSSLARSLISALGAMLGKQWVRHYTNHLFGGGAHLLRARQHQAALLASKQWRMSGVIMTIPILMHLSLFLFFVGLSIFLLGDNVIIVRTILVISILGILLYAIITILPSIYQHCPFGTPFSRFLPPFYPTFREDQDSDEHSVSDLDAKCLTWLMTYTTSTRIAHSAATAVSGLACTPSQQDILFKGGGVSVLTKALASCTVEENGSLIIRRECLDTASLLLFAARSLLSTPGSRFTQNDDHENLNMLLKKFDSNKFLDIRSNFDAADSAAAMWCILAHRSLSLQDASNSNELVSRLQKIPTSFEIPAANRTFKEVLIPCLHLVLLAQNNPVLCAWAVKRMFDFWKFEGCPSLGNAGAQILLKALMGASQSLSVIASTTGGRDDIKSFGGLDAIIQALVSLKGNIDAQQNVVKILRNMGLSPGRPNGTIFSTISIGPLIQALQSLKGNTDAQTTVANILSEISSSDHGIDTISSAARPLIQALPSLTGSTDAQGIVADVLGEILSRDRGIDVISSGGFEPLIQALALLHDSVQESLTQTLARISSSDYGVNAIICGAGVGPLIQALALCSDSNARYYIAKTLAQISSSDCGVDAIISSAGVGLFIQALLSLSGYSWVHVTTVLKRISTRNNGMDAIASAGVGPLISASASLKCDPDVRSIIVDILEKTLFSDHGIDAISESSAINRLIQALGSSTCDANVERIAADALEKILSSDRGIDVVCESSAVGQLIQALTSLKYYARFRRTVTDILDKIYSNDCGMDSISKSNEGAGPFIQALALLDDSGQESITRILSKMTYSRRGVDAIISGTGPIIKAFMSKPTHRKPAHRSRRSSEQQVIKTSSIILLCRIAVIFRTSALQRNKG